MSEKKITFTSMALPNGRFLLFIEGTDAMDFLDEDSLKKMTDNSGAAMLIVYDGGIAYRTVGEIASTRVQYGWSVNKDITSVVWDQRPGSRRDLLGTRREDSHDVFRVVTEGDTQWIEEDHRDGGAESLG